MSPQKPISVTSGLSTKTCSPTWELHNRRELMPRHYVVDPQISGDVFVGTEGDDTQVYLGHVAETGPPRKVYFGGSQEFVVMIIGKRGSGKSHTLGTIV